MCFHKVVKILIAVDWKKKAGLLQKKDVLTLLVFIII